MDNIFGGMIIGMLFGSAVTLLAYWIVDERTARECAQAHNVFMCERVISYVPTQGETP